MLSAIIFQEFRIWSFCARNPVRYNHQQYREREIPGGHAAFFGLPLRVEIRIPAPEGILPLFVEHTGSYLQEKMCSTLAPAHLLFLHHPFAHDLIDSRLDETGGDLFPVAVAFPVIGVLGATERNAELGITFLMSSRIKCGVSGANALWERTAGDFTPHYPKTLLLSGDRLVGEEDAR